MFAIVGAAGNVGYSTALSLREAGLPVRAILHDGSKADRLSRIGCQTSIADIHDPSALARAIGDASAIQVVVPVNVRATDPAADLNRSMDGLVAALADVDADRVLTISDYGAHISFDIGMPSVFRGFEARLATLRGNRLVLRSAEHMHNWGRVVPVAIASGSLPTFQDPVDMVHPTIAAADLGVIAAGLLQRPVYSQGLEIIHAEGPSRYSAADVAAALAELSGKAIEAAPVPRPQWRDVFTSTMPASLADLLIKAADAKNQGGMIDVEANAGDVIRGETALIDALRPLCIQPAR